MKMLRLTIPSTETSAWIDIFSDVLGVSIRDNLDSIDVSFCGINSILSILNDDEATVLYLRYVDGMTLEETGVKFGKLLRSGKPITKEQIRQKQAKALRKLRHKVRTNKLKSHIAGWFNLNSFVMN